MNKKIIALVLACLCVFFPVLTGCADKGGKGDGGVTGGDIGDPNLTEKDWDGEEFNVLTQKDRSDAQAFNVVDLAVGEKDDLSDPIKKAVYERNERIKSVYNAEIVRIADENYQNIATDTLAYGGDYSAYMLKVQGALTLALSKLVLDMNSEVGYINLHEAWWDTTTIDSLAVRNRAFFALGDINVVDDDATWCVLFNKGLAENYTSLPNFYDTVRAGDWTLENMCLWASKSIIEENGDGSSALYDPNNPYQYGLYYQDMCSTVLLSAAGITPYIKEKNGTLTARLGSTELQNAIDVIRDNMMLENPKHDAWALNIDNISWQGDKWQLVARGGFAANKALFFMCHCGSINLLRDMDNDFGILPIPKLSEGQEEYGNTVQYGNATCYVIPYNTPDPDFSGFMIEAMGYLSSPEAFEATEGQGSLRYAYYETTLKRKASRDDDSWDMLDLVFDNRIFDISLALDAGKINGLVYTATTTDTAWATLMGSNSGVIDGEVKESIAYLMK